MTLRSAIEQAAGRYIRWIKSLWRWNQWYGDVAFTISFHNPDRKAISISQHLIGHAAAEETFDPGRSMSPHHNRLMTLRPFKNISRDIVLVAELQGHALRVESGVFQGLTGVLQDMTLGFPFLPNPIFLFVVQLLIHLGFDGGILRSSMLQQPPRHRLEDMKERDGHVRCSAQKRSNIPDSTMRVFGLVDGKKNSHSVLLRKQRR